MTVPEFEAVLKAVCQDTYEIAAPKGLLRYVVWHRYGKQSAFGDDCNAVNLPKVQIDIVTNRNNDSLAEDVCNALCMAYLPYSIISDGYDPDYNAFRSILQLVVI